MVPDRRLDCEVEAAAVRLLAGREHSRRELQRKLRERFADHAAIAAVLDDLEHRDLLSDRRFAACYVAQRAARGYGPLRIRAEMANRGVAGQLIEDALEAADIDWRESLAATAARKFGDGPAPERPARARRGRFLEQRGFPMTLIVDYLESVADA